MADSGVDHGYLNHSCGQFTVASLKGAGIGIGSFTATASSTTTIVDADIPAGAKVTIFPTSAAAALLLRSATCYVSSVVAGSFVFTVSATGAGSPAGTENFSYHFVSET